MGLNPVFDYLNQKNIAVVGKVNTFFPAALVQSGTPIGFLQEDGTLIPLTNTAKVIRDTTMSLAVIQTNQNVPLGIWPDLYYQVQQLSEDLGYQAVLACEHGTEEYAIQRQDETIAVVDHSGNVRSEDKSVQQQISRALQDVQTSPKHLRISYQLGLQKKDIKVLAMLVDQGRLKIDDVSLLETARQIARQEYDELGQMVQPGLSDEQVIQAQEFFADESRLYQLEANPATHFEAEKLKEEMEKKYGTVTFETFNETKLEGKYRRQEARFTDAQLQTLMVAAKSAGLFNTKSPLGQRIEQAVSRSAAQQKSRSNSTPLKERIEQKKVGR